MTNRCVCVCVCVCVREADTGKPKGRAAGLSYKFPHNRNENRTTTPVSPSEPWRTIATRSIHCWWHLCGMNTAPHILGSQSPENQRERHSAYKCAIPPRRGMVKPAEEADLCWQDGCSQAGCQPKRNEIKWGSPGVVNGAWTLEPGGHVFVTLLCLLSGNLLEFHKFSKL